jgi:AcrR family transcriptional regulator
MTQARKSKEQSGRRRRGAELEAALLEAAWEELVEDGFASLTMESVAARAQTGVAVLYRRWANKGELVVAAIEHFHDTHPIEVPDTGTLRGDLLGLLTTFGNSRAGFVAIVGAASFSGLLADTGLSPAQIRERFLGSRSPRNDQVIFQRAALRGELDLKKTPPAVLAMPFDLVRQDLLLNLEPPSKARLKSIVDDLFLPLIAR